MPMASEIKLQALKENVDTVEVNAVRVAPGDVVAKDQTLLEVQADKAALDVPSPVAGRVTQVLVKPGDQVKIGQTYCIIDGGNGEAATPAAPAREKAKEKEKEPDAGPARTAEQVIGRFEEETEEPTAAERRGIEKALPPKPPAFERHVPGPNERVVPAGPATRRLARELGIDLRQVRGTGRHGRVLEEDVKEYVRQLASGPPPVALPAPGGAAQAPPLPDFSEWGPVDAQPLGAVRKATARQMALAWGLVPHVTQHDLADVTDLDAFRKQQDGKGPKLTVTAFVLKAAVILLRELPHFNSSLDLANNRLVLKRYYHVGVAVDTEGGLLVPVIRDVDKKSIHQLAAELTATAERARQRKLDAAELRGGTFTITNLGGIGGTAFTPIVNYPEVAILGLSRSRLEPVVRGGQVVPRLMLPLSLSYDHRVIDGAAAARFTRRLAEMLANPLLMLLQA
jgi:pyruvate dehydrogenase E2 component (dihydrolipoamide acetyltransferase)